MGILSNISIWFKSFFDKIGALIKKLFAIAEPFIKEAASKTLQNIWSSCQDLLSEAWDYVEEQGLPTSKEKQEAFLRYMAEKGIAEVNELKQVEKDMLTSMITAIKNKANSQQ